MTPIRKFLNELWADESAISSVEYALLLAFIAAGIITAAELLSNAVENELTDTAGCIEGTIDATDPKCGG
jgi:Flp pilus assembly pilin Flp